MQNSSITRSRPISKKKYTDYKQDLRKDFLFSCAYCSTAERDLHAKRFEIDHFLPQKFFPILSNQYLNLVWSCEECNNLKSDYYPGKIKKGYVFFRPDRYNFEDHFEITGNTIIGKTEKIGNFTIKMLNLNSKRLKTLRDIKNFQTDLDHKLEFGIFSLAKKLRNPDGLDKGYIFNFLQRLKELKNNYELAIKELAYDECSAYELDEDPEKLESAKERREYASNILQ
ncbi:MAG: HNH endonuclease domain-containing protein [Candidatus Riflebacteria bacterium]|nr:HNH endonuclease domain-containing protein [Candidatus Riflebacteria bacterium]